MAWTRWMCVFVFVTTTVRLGIAGGWLLPSQGSLGTFTSENVAVCTGHTITFTCRLNNVIRGTSADLVIKMNTYNGTDAIVAPDQIQIQDNRTILYTVHDTDTAGASLRLWCCLRNCSSFDDRVGSAFGEELLVLQAPVPVEDMQCVMYDWDVHMACTWDLVVDYTKDTLKTDINMQMRYENFSEWANCPELSEDLNECIVSYPKGWINESDISMEHTQHLRGELRVQIKSRCGLNSTSFYYLEDVKVIQPAPAELWVKVVNATCLNVTIGSLANNQNRWKNYNLTYSYQLLMTDTVLENTAKVVLGDMKNRTALTLCGLIPFSKYKLSVEVSPKDETKWLWSEPVLKIQETPSTVPGASPHMLPGMFSWKRTDCQAKHDMRTVHVYIQPIKEQFWNGERRAVNFKYKSLLGGDEGEDEKPTDVMYASLRLRCDLEYTVNVQVRNDMGLSPNSSSIYIPAAGQVLDPPAFFLETTSTDGVVTFEWIGGFPATVKEYTVYQCRHNAKDNCDARSAIQNPLVESVKRSTLQISVGHENNILIGASIETDVKYSGIHWESCIYKHDGVPRKPTVNVEVGSGDNSLYVTWEKLLCRPGEPYVSKYLVSYCKLDSNQNCGENSTMEVPSDQASITLRDLDAEHEYKVYVKGMARNGNSGYYSDPVIKKPIDKSLKGEEIAGIVSGSVFLFVCAVAGIICIVRHIRRRTRHAFKLPDIDVVEFPKPAIPTEEDEEDPTHEDNNNQDGYGDSKPDDDGRGDGDLTVNIGKKDDKEFHRQQSNDSGLPQSPTIDDGYVRAVHPNGIIYADNFHPGSQDNFHPGPQVIISMNVQQATFQASLPPVPDQTTRKTVWPDDEDQTTRKTVWPSSDDQDLFRTGADLSDSEHASGDKESVTDSGHCLINGSRPETLDTSVDGNNSGHFLINGVNSELRPETLDTNVDDNNVDVNGKGNIFHKNIKNDAANDAGDSLDPEGNDEDNTALLDSGYVLASCSAEGEPELSKPKAGNKLMSGGCMSVVSDLTAADHNTEMCPLREHTEIHSFKNLGNMNPGYMSQQQANSHSTLVPEQNMTPSEYIDHSKMPSLAPTSNAGISNSNSEEPHVSIEVAIPSPYITTDLAVAQSHPIGSHTAPASNDDIHDPPTEYVDEALDTVNGGVNLPDKGDGGYIAHSDSNKGDSGYLAHSDSNKGEGGYIAHSDNNKREGGYLAHPDSNKGEGGYIAHFDSNKGEGGYLAHSDSNKGDSGYLAHSDSNKGEGGYIAHSDNNKREGGYLAHSDSNKGEGGYIAHSDSNKGDSGYLAHSDNNKGEGGYIAHSDNNKREGGYIAHSDSNKGEGGYIAHSDSNKGDSGYLAHSDSNKGEGGYIAHSDSNKGEGGYLAHSDSNKGDSGYLAHSDSNKGEGGYIAHSDSNKGEGGYLAHSDSNKGDSGYLAHSDSNKGEGGYLAHPDSNKGDSGYLAHSDNNKGEGGYLAHPDSNKGEGGYLPQDISQTSASQTPTTTGNQLDGNTGMGGYLSHDNFVNLDHQSVTHSDSQPRADSWVADNYPHNIAIDTGYLPHASSLDPADQPSTTAGFGNQSVADIQTPDNNSYLPHDTTVTPLPGESSFQGQTPMTSDTSNDTGSQLYMSRSKMQAEVASPGYVSTDDVGGRGEGVIEHLSGVYSVDGLPSPDSDSGCSSLTSNTDTPPINLDVIPIPHCFADGI